MSDELRISPSLTSLTSLGFCGPPIVPIEDQDDNISTTGLKKDYPRNVNFWRFSTLKEVTAMSYHGKKELLDYYQVGIICYAHKRIAVQLYDDQLCGLPNVIVPVGGGQKAMFLYQVLDKVIPKAIRKDTILTTKPRIESYTQVEDPRTGQYVRRKTVYHWINSQKCCQHTEKIFWVSLEDLKNGMELDCLEHSSIIMRDDQAYNLLNLVVNGIESSRPLVELDSDSMLAFSNEESSPIRKFIEADCISEKTITSLLHEFICHCWPSTVMSFPLFCQFMAKISPSSVRQYIGLDNVKRLFYAMTLRSRYVLDFQDLFIGLITMEENLCLIPKASPYFQIIQDVRLRFQFRYFDTHRKGYLVDDNLILVVKDIVEEADHRGKLKGLKEEYERKKFMAEYFSKKGNKAKYTFKDFCDFILTDLPKSFEKYGKDVVNVYSSLFRLKYDLQHQIEKLFNFSSFDTAIKPKSRYGFYEPSTRKCDSCSTPYRVSDSKIQINMRGQVMAIFRLTVSQSQKIDPKTILCADLPDIRIHKIALDVLLRIRYYAEQIFIKKSNIDDDILAQWSYTNKNDQINAIEMIVNHAKEIFSKERRVVPVQTPAFVFGDIHGNLRDLSQFFNSNLFGKLPFMATNKCVFLGDYVDRGDWSVEVVVTLFCLKILAPETVYLVRGNHELRSVQHEFGFMTECKAKVGLEFWRMFNETFDLLPISCIIDDRIYGAHGGIPTSGTTVEQLRKAATPLANPNVECPEAWEAMWNDPLNEKDAVQLRLTDAELIKKTGGFVLNQYRGTGYRYLTEAVINFLRRNDLDFIVRAHEAQMQGFKFYNQGLTISVFSTSNYIGSTNCAGVLHIGSNKIRCIQIERAYKPEIIERII